MNKQYEIDSNMFILEITQACNFSCAFCFSESDVVPKSQKYMDFNLFKKAIDILASNKCNVVALSGGEPLMHPSLKYMLTYLTEKNLRTIVITNGYFVDDDWINFLLANDKIKIQFSLDGVDETTHDKLRASGSYKKVVSAMHKLHSLGYNNGEVRMTITKDNYLQAGGVYKIATEKQFKPSFSFVQNLGKASNAWDNLKLSPDECKHTQDTLMREIGSHLLLGSIMSNLEPLSSCSILLEIPRLKPYVDVNLNVRPCAAISYSMGNLVTDSYDYIFGTGLHNLTDTLTTKRNERIKIFCSKCVGKVGCTGGCLGVAPENPNKPTSECYRIIGDTTRLILNKCGGKFASE